jgi:hypothetical protein
MPSTHAMAGFHSEDDLLKAVADTQADLERAGHRMSPEAESLLVAALRADVAEHDYARLDGALWDLE